jgi:tetratricopeptide (TPR) repeat protein
MKKTVSLVMAAMCCMLVVNAQSVADGIKYIAYQKSKSAVDVFSKNYNSNSKNPEAVYWYGQALLANEDIAAAKAVYQKALQEGVNDPWIWIGAGHVELLEGGDINAAKQKFEQAITATTGTKGKNKGKADPAILTAIGRANADGGSKFGDANYGIEKLKLAGELDNVSANIYIYMGICYRKLGGEMGGEAVKAFTEASTRDPKNPIGFHFIGQIYASQSNKDLMDEFYGKAIGADIDYPPVYLDWFRYYQDKNVNIAKDYIEKYVTIADKDCKTDYFYTNYLFRAGKYQESLEKTKAMDAGDCKTFVMLPVLYAFNYDRLGDSLQAKTYLEKFFAIAPLDKIEPIHYELAVKVFSKFPGSEMVAASYLQKAIENDTTKANKLSYMKQAADMFGKAKMYGEQVKWLTKYNDLKGTMGEYDHYLITSSAYSGMDYVATMTYAQKYIVAFSEKPQGYVFNVKAAKALDTTTTPGILVEALLFNNKYLSLDTVKNNKTIASNYYTIMIHYADRMKDYVTALEYCNKFLAIYPADPEMLGIKKTLETMVNKIKTPAKSASGAKATTTTDGSTPK